MALKRTIRAGVIGPGGVGNTHIDSLRRLENVKVTAIAVRSEDRAVFYGKKYDIDHVYSDYRRLLDNKEIDVVHVATPNYLHFEQVKYALEVGKHVVCEKPLGMNARETAELLSLANSRGVVHAINFNFRFFPLVQQARAICARGELGDIVTVIGGCLSDDFFDSCEYNWRMDPERGGPSLAVSAIGCHWLDLVQFISGLHVKEVFAEFANIWPTRDRAMRSRKGGIQHRTMKCPLEECASVLLRFDNGARGNMVVSLVSAGREFELFFEIDGLRSSVGWSLPDANRLWRGFGDRPNQVVLRNPLLLTAQARKFVGAPTGEIEGYHDSFRQHFRSIYSYIATRGHFRGLTAPFPTFEDGHNIQVVIDSTVESARSEKWVRVAGK